MRFLAALRAHLAHFNREAAEALSEEIHFAEKEGHQLSQAEEDLWEELTSKIIEPPHR